MTLSYPDPVGALHVPYLDRQPWECATILSDGTLCGQEITYEPLRFCAECAGRFLARRDPHRHVKFGGFKKIEGLTERTKGLPR